MKKCNFSTKEELQAFIVAQDEAINIAEATLGIECWSSNISEVMALLPQHIIEPAAHEVDISPQQWDKRWVQAAQKELLERIMIQGFEEIVLDEQK